MSDNALEQPVPPVPVPVSPATLRRRLLKALTSLVMRPPRTFLPADFASATPAGSSSLHASFLKHRDAFASASFVADAADAQALADLPGGNAGGGCADPNAVDIAMRVQVAHVVFQWMFAPENKDDRGCRRPPNAHKCACRSLGANAWPPAWGLPFDNKNEDSEYNKDGTVALPTYTLQENALASELLQHDTNVPGRALASLCQTFANETLASLLAGGGVELERCNAFAAAATEARLASSWSVPTPEALRTLAVFAPLVEVGTGAPATWARLLVAVYPNADVVAYHGDWQPDLAGEGVPPEPEHLQEILARDFVDPAAEAAASALEQASAGGGLQLLRGGAECLRRHRGDGRTLVLMNPDYGGIGTFGLRCVESYEGEHLITVGEWAPLCTYGAYADDVRTSVKDASGMSRRPCSHGQSFSREVQELVEREFTAVNVLRLPSFPMFCDILVVWKRK